MSFPCRTTFPVTLLVCWARFLASIDSSFGDAADYCSRLESIPTVENVQESESFTLCCDVGHRPTDWTKDGETITFKPGSRYEREKNWRGFLTHLQVAKATYEDDNGTVYRCTGGDRETSIMVKVHPKAVVSLREPLLNGFRLEAFAGESVLLNCTGYHLKFLQWYDEEAKYVHSPRFHITHRKSNSVERNSVLVINPVRAVDEGQYTCSGPPLYGRHHPFVTLSLRVLQPEAPRFLIVPQSMLSRDRVSLSCSAVGLPSPRLYWIRESRSGGIREKININGNLTIESLKPSDEGAYYCVAENLVTSIRSAPAVISIIIPASQQHVRREMNVLLSDPLKGKPVLITCAFRRRTNVTWLKDSVPINSDNPRLFFPDYEQGSALAIPSASYEDQGLYVANSYYSGTLSQSCQTRLFIRGPPLAPRRVAAALLCQFGFLRLFVSWSSPFFRGDGSDFHYGLRLKIIDVENITIFSRKENESTVNKYFSYQLGLSCSHCVNSLAYLIEVYSVNSNGKSESSLPRSVEASASAFSRTCNVKLTSTPILKSYPGFQFKLKQKGRSCYKNLKTSVFDKQLEGVVSRMVHSAVNSSNHTNPTGKDVFHFDLASSSSFHEFVVRVIMSAALSVDSSLQAIQKVKISLSNYRRYGKGLIFERECELDIVPCTTFYADGIEHTADCKILSKKPVCRLTGR
ncbi:neogenin-like isoform X2 [Oscarella lobularis]|uniref:neogenin-like isoform X2 n=1 Tax=Oscarella lobularis TaxID=121494 RepID=UPI0033143828